MSEGSKKIHLLLLEVLGDNIRIDFEYCVGENLRLDFYLPDYKLGVEYHGRQHREFVEHFHGTVANFKDSQRRDRRKLELCAEQGVSVAVFWDNEEVTSEVISERIEEAILEQNILLKELPPDFKKEAASEFRSEQYQKYKQSKTHEQQLERARKARKERYWYAKQRYRTPN